MSKRQCSERLRTISLSLLIACGGLLSTAGGGHQAAQAASPETLPLLKVSDNGRFLVTETGAPFFYLGDTAWMLYSSLTGAEADEYFEDRAEKGFTVIHTSITGSLERTNVYGATPFLTVNPSLPYNKTTNPFDPTKPNELYFEHVDLLIDKAQAHGLYVAVVPVWGSIVTANNSVFNETNAVTYGQFLGERYRNKPVVWILGGDENPVYGADEDYRPFWRALAQGLESGDNGSHLMTYHPRGGARSANFFHNEPWLDFNMNQSGHYRNRSDFSMIDMIAKNYSFHVPPKPTIDGESGYENIPEGLTNGGTRTMNDDVPQEEKLSAYDVRTKSYWSLFAGAFGYVYGANGVYQFTKDGVPDSWRWDPDMTWDEAIGLPGAGQMQYVRRLMESRPFLTRIPDQSVIAAGGGDRYDTVQATRDSDGSYAFVYITSGNPISVNMSKISGSAVNAYWFDPRTGDANRIGTFPNEGAASFTPPSHGTDHDWVLVLDDAAKHYRAPGQPAGGSNIVNASYDAGEGLVTVTGSIAAGKGERLTVRVIDPANQVNYADQLVSGEGGTFSFSYSIGPLPAAGTYEVIVGGLAVTAPVAHTFVVGP